MSCHPQTVVRPASPKQYRPRVEIILRPEQMPSGTMLEMSIFTERDDLSAVIEHIKTLDVVDQENLFLLGESQGGCVAGITAPRHRDDIQAMVQYYPAFCIPDDARKRFASVSEIPETYKVFNQKSGRVYAEKLLDFDIYREIARYDRPVLIIHGDADKVVDISYGRRAAEVYADAQAFVLHPFVFLHPAAALGFIVRSCTNREKVV